MPRIILHLDMNSYFASVEQQANPFLRGKPVAICAYLSANGCIIASSVEAKKLGVKVGLRVKEAKAICLDIILLENDPDKYRAVTRKVFEIMSAYSARFEPYSIDEAFLDLTGYVGDFIQAEKIAEQIRQRIKKEIGEWLKCSIGISFTKFLAKFASDFAGVDQNVIISSLEQLETIYGQHQLTDLWGIGKKLEKRLGALGIYSISDLKNYPVQNLIQVFGKQGYFLWARVNGLEIDQFKDKSDLSSKSIGHSYCLPKQTTDKNYLLTILAKLVSKVAQRLRERHQTAYGIYIHWSYINQSLIFLKNSVGFGKSFKLKKPAYTTDDIFQKVRSILDKTKLTGRVGMLAVGVFNLCPLINQLSLFSENSHNGSLDEVISQIHRKYGNYAVYKGRLWKTQEQAKDRIGFRKVEI